MSDAPTPAQRVADELRDAFAALASAPLNAEQRATFQRRLLAITTTSKRDIGRAQEQLQRLRNDLAAASDVKDSFNELT